MNSTTHGLTSALAGFWQTQGGDKRMERPPEQPATNGHSRTPSEEERLILAGYEESRRRDALGAQDKWHWKIAAGCLLLYGGIATGLALWMGLRPRVWHAPVQLVQVNEGKVEPIGPPQELLTYQPSDAQWMEMVTQWVLKRRWKSGDGPVTAEQINWVAMHTCGPAVEDVQRWEKEEKPLEIGKRRVQVEVTAVTKPDAPRAYNVLWKEYVTDQNRAPSEERWAGTFTVSRVKLTTPAMVLHNRLGLCVNAYSWARQP